MNDDEASWGSDAPSSSLGDVVQRAESAGGGAARFCRRPSSCGQGNEGQGGGEARGPLGAGGGPNRAAATRLWWSSIRQRLSSRGQEHEGRGGSGNAWEAAPGTNAGGGGGGMDASTSASRLTFPNWSSWLSRVKFAQFANRLWTLQICKGRVQF